MINKYNHWFWNSRFIDFIAHRVASLNSWLWKMQYGRK